MVIVPIGDFIFYETIGRTDLTGGDEEEMAYTTEVMKDGLHVKGFDQVAAYMYGDEVAKNQGFQPVGLSRNAGYTIGYHLVKAYLNNTGATIAEATLTSTEEIITNSKFF